MNDKILIADDEPSNRKILEQELTHKGFAVDTAPGGKEALLKIASASPDLVILDYMMPDLSGFEVLKQLRKKGNDTPVIMITAYGSIERAVEVMDANPDIVLTFGGVIEWHDHLPFPAIKPAQNYTWQRHDLLKQLCVTTINISTCTTIGRTQTQKTIGGYKASLPHSGDLEMWLRFAANGSVARIDAVQGLYRKHSVAMSNAYYADRMRDFSQAELAFNSFFDEYQHRLPRYRGLRAAARRALSRRMFARGIGLLARTHLNDGLRLLRASIDMDPQLRYRPPVLWVLLKVAGKAKARFERTSY